MENKSKNLLIKSILIISAVIFLVIIIYFYISFKKTKEETNRERVFTYLTTTYKNDTLSSKSPLLGLLNYNFEEVPNTLSIDALIKSNLMASSKMNEIGVDNIYNDICGMSKNEYMNKSNYLLNGNTNCYYRKNVLNENINCDNICSMSTSDIMVQINKILQWDNVLPEDTKKFCIKNAIYPIEGNGYFVSLNDMKSVFKNLTNKELILNSEIVNNKYYSYNAYLVTSISRLDDNIKNIISIDNIKNKGNIYIAEYTALTDKLKELKGEITLSEENNKFYIISNTIDTNYSLK